MPVKALNSEESKSVLKTVAEEIANKYGYQAQLNGAINALKIQVILGEVVSGLAKRSIYLVEKK